MLTPKGASHNPGKRSISDITNTIHKKIIQDFGDQELISDRLSAKLSHTHVQVNSNSSTEKKDIFDWYTTLERLYVNQDIDQYMLLSQQFFSLYPRERIEEVLGWQGLCTLLLWQGQYYIEHKNIANNKVPKLAWILNALSSYVDVMYQSPDLIGYYLCLKIRYQQKRGRFQEVLDGLEYHMDPKFLASLSFDIQVFIIEEKLTALYELKQFEAAWDLLIKTLLDSQLGKYIFNHKHLFSNFSQWKPILLSAQNKDCP